MKVFILRNILCDYSCGVIIVAARNKEEAIKIIKDKRPYGLRGHSVNWANIEDHIEEIGKGYYSELFGGG
jgi:hypothetical protein